ncbi:MAG TPA: hypothetical protein VI861_01780 [Rickettsiales bacterium]|nr:hypothetical protein [Rickettsiales bacterium]
MKKFKKFIKNLNRIYLYNSILIFSLVFAIMLNLAVQFKVENLQDHIENMQGEISSYRDQISLLEVEWAYLTRPARIRDLSQKYLNDNGYTLASQIKGNDELERFYTANYEVQASQVAANF